MVLTYVLYGVMSMKKMRSDKIKILHKTNITVKAHL